MRYYDILIKSGLVSMPAKHMVWFYQYLETKTFVFIKLLINEIQQLFVETSTFHLILGTASLTHKVNYDLFKWLKLK